MYGAILVRVVDRLQVGLLARGQYSLTKFQILQQVLGDGDDENTEERVDAVRAAIIEFDPLPFEDEDSQWHLAFDEVIDGIW